MKQLSTRELCELFARGFRDTREKRYPRDPKHSAEPCYRIGHEAATAHVRGVYPDEEKACAEFEAMMNSEVTL